MSPDNIYPFAWALDGRRIGETASAGGRSDVSASFLVRRVCVVYMYVNGFLELFKQVLKLTKQVCRTRQTGL